jgi:hypothetical protein
MKLINLCPHAITLRAADGTDTIIRPRMRHVQGEPCSSCGGTGSIGEGNDRDCRACGGSGHIDPIDVPDPARVEMTPGEPEIIEGVPVPVYGCNRRGNIIGLPDEEQGTLYIVSVVVASSETNQCLRHDLVYPGTGPKDGAVRDEKGQIVAVTRLIRA